MSKIEIGRYSDQLRRMFGMAGVMEVAAELSPEITATIELEGPSAEWNYLKGVRDAGCGADIAAAVGFLGNNRLRNPVGSGVIATIKGVALTSVTSRASYVIARGVETGDLALGTVNTTVLDERWAALGQTSLIWSVTNLDAAGQAGRAFVRGRLLADTQVLYPFPIVLPPGTSLDFGSADSNIRIIAWAAWSERALPLLEAR